MEWIADPTIWAGLATLLVLEIVLGIDNLVFIAILADKLPKQQRDKARVVGLLLALVMRLALLASISWLATLTKPMFIVAEHPFSGRDLIMLVGGIFLLFKATMELNERLEGKDEEQHGARKGARFWPVVAQIVVLDAVFSLDSVITAVGMVDHLAVMMIAVCIAIGLMLLASKPLTRFVNAHPTIVILCLSFLLMIGFSLVAEGFGYHIPKGYLYAAIGFSVMIEALNQLPQFNRRRFLSKVRPLRERTAEAVLRMLSGKHEEAEVDSHSANLLADSDSENGEIFNQQERRMIERVLGMAQRTVSSIMTSRHDVEYLELNDPQEKLTQLLERNQHTRIVVVESSASDEPLGVIHTIDVLKQQLAQAPLDLRALIRQPLIFPEQLTLLSALEQFRQAQTHFAFVVDEFGSVEGVVTLTDVMETIAGNLPEAGEEVDARHDIQQNEDGSWIANGYMPLEDLVLYLPMPLEDKREYHTLAGLLMEHSQRVPQEGEQMNGSTPAAQPKSFPPSSTHFILCIMYIPRPAKLLFQHDEGWERFLEKNGHQLSDWTKLSVERMLACGTCAMGVRHYCCSSADCTHSRFLCQTCKSKACSSCGLKGTEQWIAEQQHILPDCDWQHITFTMPHLLWPFFNNNWPLLNDLFRCATPAMLRHARKLGIEVGIFCALHTYGRQLNQHPHIHVSITRGGLDVKHGVWRDLFFKKQQVEEIWRGAVIRLLRASYDRVNPASLPGHGHIRDEKQWKRYLQAQYQRHWKVHFAKKTRGAWRSVKYLGRYLKRPPVAASQLRHYRGGSVVHQYYDHNTQQHKRQKLSQEEMLRRYVSHIPDRHFKMVRYYGFLANRKRGTLLPKVYEALEMTPREKPQKPGFAVLMKAFLGTDPYQCILCKGRLRFAGAIAGEHATKMLSDRLHRMAKKRWLQTLLWISAPEKWGLA